MHPPSIPPLKGGKKNYPWHTQHALGRSAGLWAAVYSGVCRMRRNDKDGRAVGPYRTLPSKYMRLFDDVNLSIA